MKDSPAVPTAEPYMFYDRRRTRGPVGIMHTHTRVSVFFFRVSTCFSAIEIYFPSKRIKRVFKDFIVSRLRCRAATASLTKGIRFGRRKKLHA